MDDLRMDKHCVEYNVLVKMNNDLCNALPIDGLFPSMISNHVIDFQDKAEICSERTERRRVQYFLDNYLIKGLNCEVPDTSRFYRFLKVMERSPKCNFLVKRINHWLELYKDALAKPGQSTSSHSAHTTAAAGANVAKTPGHVPVSPGHGSGKLGHVATSPGNVSVGGDDCLVTGKASKTCMRLMQKYVIPKISEDWEEVAAFLDYPIHIKNDIKAANKSPAECCKALIEDWLATDNGVKPKTWKKLIEVLSEVEDLRPVIEEIKLGLMSEGVTLVSPVEESYDFNQEEPPRAGGGDQYPPPYNPHHQGTQDATAQRWGQYPQSSMNPMSMTRNEQFEMYGRPSYDMPSADFDQYGRPMVANLVQPTYYRPPQPHATNVDQYGRPMVHDPVPPTYNRPPHASSVFIVYTKEDNDPHGEQVLCLSNLLTNCGIQCDIDLYHANENVMDWSFWVGKSLEYHIVSDRSYVIMVCSPNMISILEERNDIVRVDMVAGHIDRLTLRHYLEVGANKFLPVIINDPSADYIPPNLSGKTCYHFPYNKLCEMRENISAREVLDDPDFASLRTLVATLTGQPENPVPNVGNVPVVQNPPVGGNTRPSAAAYGGMSHGDATVRRTEPQRPPTGNSPKIIRRDPELAPSTLDQDASFNNNTDLLVSHVPQNVTPRTKEHHQTGYNVLYNEQVADTQQPLIGAQGIGQPSSVVATVQPEEETGIKRPREPSPLDSDSCYSTPNESPRNDSLGTVDSSHFPIEATSSMPPNDSMHTVMMGQATVCSEEEGNSYHAAMAKQKQRSTT